MKAWRQRGVQERWLKDIHPEVAQRVQAKGYRVGRMCRDSKERILPVASHLVFVLMLEAGWMKSA